MHPGGSVYLGFGVDILRGLRLYVYKESYRYGWIVDVLFSLSDVDEDQSSR